jgi:hypothetical protein
MGEVGGRNAGRDAFGGFDRLREGGAVLSAVALRFSWTNPSPSLEIRAARVVQPFL